MQRKQLKKIFQKWPKDKSTVGVLLGMKNSQSPCIPCVYTFSTTRGTVTIIGILFVSDLKTMFHYKNTHDNCPVKSQSRMDPNYEPSKILMRDLVAENLLNSAVRKQSCTSAQRTTYSQWIRTTCNPSTMH